MQNPTLWPTLETTAIDMKSLYESTPTARVLSILQTLMATESNGPQTVELPLSAGSSMRMTVS